MMPCTPSPSKSNAMSNSKSSIRKIPRIMTRKRLENIAVHYLRRYASSCENLRRVLLRRADKAILFNGGDREEIKLWIEDIINQMIRSNVLNDARYALDRTTTLRRMGRAPAKIRSQLTTKGISRAIIDNVLAETAVTANGEDATLKAAMAYACRRNLGPFSEKPRTQDGIQKQNKKHLAILARAGFTYDIACLIIEMVDK